MTIKKDLDYGILINLVLSCFLLIVFLIWSFYIAIYFYFLLGCVVLFTCWESNDILTNISTIIYCVINLTLLAYFNLPLESKVSYFEFHLIFSPFLLLCCVLILQIRRLFINTFGNHFTKRPEKHNEINRF